MRQRRALSAIERSVLLGAWVLPLLLSPARSAATVYAHRTPLTFTWAAAAGTVDRYQVYLSVDGRASERIAETATPSCRVTVQDRGRYVMRVQAENSQGSGPLSDPSEEVVVFLNGSPGDTDGDGLPDSWETAFGLDPFNPDDAGADPDGDGLSNRDEFVYGTSPASPDTDGDGVSDGLEVQTGQNPLDPADNRPVADAGPDQAQDPTRVTLDGSKSRDPNGDPLSYRWTQTEGPSVALADPRTSKASFLGRASGLYRFRLVVNDGKADSTPDEVAVTIRNVAPSADAGPDQVVDAGSTVTLNGGGSSDPNEDTLTYSWSQKEGPTVALQSSRTQTCWFVPEASGVYRFALVVSDGRLASAPDEVQVIVHGLNQVPTADAGGDQTVPVNTKATLDGSGSSDPDGDTLTYVWTQREGPALIFLTGPRTARPSFTPARVGVYRFRLVVNDGTDDSAPDEVTVTVEGANHAPVAVVQESVSAAVGDWVELNGEESFDPDSDPITYAWFQTQGPRVVLQGADQAIAGFYTVTAAALRFQLVVDDGELYSSPAVVEVTVDLNNRVPAADAGGDFAASPGSEVCLDGSDSYDLNPTRAITFFWSQEEGPRVTLYEADTESPCFTPVLAGDYVFGLVVSDGTVQSAQDLVTVRVDTHQVAPAVSSPGEKSSSGCSSLRTDGARRNPTIADWLFVLCLFLPALATAAALKRRVRGQARS